MRTNYLIRSMTRFSVYVCGYFVHVFVYTTIILTSSLNLFLWGKVVSTKSDSIFTSENSFWIQETQKEFVQLEPGRRKPPGKRGSSERERVKRALWAG